MKLFRRVVLTSFFLGMLMPNAKAGDAAIKPLAIDAIANDIVVLRRKAGALRARLGLKQASIVGVEGEAQTMVVNAGADYANIVGSGSADVREKENAHAAWRTASQGVDLLAQSGKEAPGLVAAGRIISLLGNATSGASLAEAQVNAEARREIAATNFARVKEQEAEVKKVIAEMKGEHKAIAVRVGQFERLANAKEMLVSAEKWRVQAEAIEKNHQLEVVAAKNLESFMKNMSVW